MNVNALCTLFSKQFLIFISGGLLSALIDIGTMAVLLRMSVSSFIATTSGFALGLGVNYIFHSSMTFGAQKTIRSVTRYIIIVGLNYGMTLAFVFVAQLLNLGAIAGKMMSLPFVAINGFLLSKYWAFR
jgi:putative flippase GtrA